MEFVHNSWIFLVFLAVIVYLKLKYPKKSFEMKASLIVAIMGTIIFATIFITSIEDNFNLWPLIYCLLFCYYIYAGGKKVAYKTTTGVFSKKSGEPIGHMNAGSFMNWADPIFEIVTVSVDGVPNKSADLQKLEIIIPETPLMQTSTRGIQAKVKKISFMLKLEAGKLFELLDIEGGAVTVKERIVEYIDEFFLKKISKKSPEDLDQDKENTIKTLAKNLKKEVNDFCNDNNYPYQITGDVIIADTELEAKYYEVLSKREFTKLEQEAKDVEAKKLRGRLAKFGKQILPNGTEKEQMDAAYIGLGIVKRDINENKIAVDPELIQLVKDIALYFKS
jgi:hypothetical protein